MHIHTIDGTSCRDKPYEYVTTLVKESREDPNKKMLTMVMAQPSPADEEEEEEEEEEDKGVDVDALVSAAAESNQNKSTEIPISTAAVIKNQVVKDLSELAMNEAVLRMMFEVYDGDEEGAFTGKELLRWINDSSVMRTKLLHLPKQQLRKKEERGLTKTDGSGGSSESGLGNESTKEDKEKKKRKKLRSIHELGTRVLWAIAWGTDNGGKMDAGLSAMGNNMTFRSFMKWVRCVVQLEDVDRQAIIADAVSHHIGRFLF